MFDSLLFEKGHFKALQFSLTQMIAAHFICIIKWHIATTFSFNENKQENVSVTVISLSNISRPQIFVRE